ncbi:MAG TPA: CRTAC1 family protein, partial [Opitutaceae bacterium]
IPETARRREGASAALIGGGVALSRAGQPTDRLGVLRAAGLALSPEADESGPYCRLRDKLGVAILDYDLDGRMDIVSAEGMAEPGIIRFEGGRSFASSPALLWNNGRGWTSVAGQGSGPLGGRLVGRGVAVADIRGTGSLDIVVAQNGGPPRILRNDQRSHNAWLRVDLVGTHCQRDAGGARVEVHTPSGILVQTMEPAMGFMAQSEKTLTFGLGADSRVRSVVVRWPGGARQEIRPPGVNRRIVVTEPR